MENTDGHVKFQKNYGLIHVQLNGNCQMWRSDVMSEDGGSLSADVFVDILEQKWHANLKIANLFAPVSMWPDVNVKCKELALCCPVGGKFLMPNVLPVIFCSFLIGF